jgi:general stress protein 26
VTSEEIITAAKELIAADRPFVLATVDQDGGPQVRWMGAVMLEEPLICYMAAGGQSRKMEQLKANARAQLMFQSEKLDRVATLNGAAEMVENADTKHRAWDAMPGCADYFPGPDAPEFGVIKFVCERVELLDMEAQHEPFVAEL